jgi:hypothetical protein
VSDAYAANRKVAARRSQTNEVLQARRGVEWGVQPLLSGFPRLKEQLPDDQHYTGTLLGLIFRLFNLRCRRMQLTQMRSVYHGPPLQHPAAAAAPSNAALLPSAAASAAAAQAAPAAAAAAAGLAAAAAAAAELSA